MFFVFRHANIRGSAENLDVIQSENSIVENSDATWLQDLDLIRISKNWRMVNDIIGLPLPWRTRGVDLRRILLVKAGCLAMIISLVVVRIQNLDFVMALQIYSAVAAFLSV